MNTVGLNLAEGPAKAGGSMPNQSLASGDTIPGDASTTAVINGGTPAASMVIGWINTPGDRDWYRMEVEAGVSYTISLSANESSISRPALPDPTLRVYNAAGELIAVNVSTNGVQADVRINAGVAGHVFVSAEGTNGSTGRYSTFVVAEPYDIVPNSTATGVNLALGGSVEGRIEADDPGDWHRIELTAGVLYEFNMRAIDGSALDTVLQLRDARGAVLASNDDFGDGTDSRVTFLATESGVHYLDARGFEDSTGRFRLDAKLGSFNDIRGTLDWGTRVPGDNVVNVYFAPAGVARDGVTSGAWSDYEAGRAMAAFAAYEQVLNLRFVRVADASQAEFTLVVVDQGLEEGVLGMFYPPGEPDAGLGVFARYGRGWDEQGGGGLEEGGEGFTTLVHEIGHGLGLAHPHDNGGTSTLMTGVNEGFDSYGAYNLNQGVFTIMSYNDGWALGPNGLSPSSSYGLQTGPMPLDIAVLQAKYGANSGARAGDDVYLLSEVNRSGVGYRAVWDTGGTDTIEHRGSASATIDLRAATIDYSATGGGAVSFVRGVHGGFVVAQGVVIENARGGSGADVLRGNAAANALWGGSGDDRLDGGSGDDLLDGGDGVDTADYGASTRGVAVDLGRSGPQETFGAGVDHLVGVENVTGGAFADALTGSAGANVLYAGEGNDIAWGGDGDDQVFMKNGEDRAFGDEGRDYLEGGGGSDLMFGGPGDDWLEGDYQGPWVDNGPEGADTLFGDDGNDVVRGNAGDDQLFGVSGDDRLEGGAGADRLDGGMGADLLDGGEGVDTAVYGGASGPVIVDLNAGGRQNTFSAGLDELRGIENVEGSAFGDALTGSGVRNVLNAGEGDDYVWGGGGDDLIFSKNGRDQAFGDDGSDYVEGGGGDDVLFGGRGNDWLEGDYQGAWFDNGPGGNDRLYGDDGDDVLQGGAGADVMTGGAGADWFLFRELSDSGVHGLDRVEDFNGYVDRMDLSRIDADANTAGDQAFRFVGALSGQAGQAVLSYDAGRNISTLRLDVNGDGQSDFTLEMVGAHDTNFGWVL